MNEVLRGAAVQLCAEMCHNTNRAYCHALGDFSQPIWDAAPSWQRESAIAGVNYALDNPTVTPEVSHENWMKQKLADGWKYGPVKNTETKEHPCLVAFDQLPAEQRVKDYIFLGVVKSFFGLK